MALQRVWKAVSSAEFVIDVTESDPYMVLGIASDATEDDIKKAYKQLSLQCHPDKNPEDSSAKEKFQKVLDAYTLLMDPAFRENYLRISAGLQAYSQNPQPWAYEHVHTAVFESKQGHNCLKEILQAEVSHSMLQFADCLRQPLSEPHMSWLQRAISEMCTVRNRLYCLQGFAFGGRRHGFDEAWPTIVSMERESAGIDHLASGFWANVIRAVNVDNDCAMLLPRLVEIWCRCGCPVTGLCVPAVPKDKAAHDAMRAAFAARNANLLSPSLLRPSSSTTCPLHIKHRSFTTMVAGFLSDEDLRRFFCIRRVIGNSKSSLMPLSITQLSSDGIDNESDALDGSCLYVPSMYSRLMSAFGRLRSLLAER